MTRCSFCGKADHELQLRNGRTVCPQKREQMTWIWACFSNEGGSRRVTALVEADSVEELREKGKKALRLQGAVVDMALEDGTIINDDSQVMFAALPEEIQVNFEIIEGQGVLDRYLHQNCLDLIGQRVRDWVFWWGVDATEPSGRLGRLVNDSKLGNCKMQKVMVGQVPHLCLFATRTITQGEELRYDYGLDDLPWRKQARKSLKI
eukprot:gene9908-18508_t